MNLLNLQVSSFSSVWGWWQRPWFFIVVIALGGLGCRENLSSSPSISVSATSSMENTNPMASASASASIEESRAVAPLMTDRALGTLIDSISEVTGEFPSDNFVSNETSYLHVADVFASEQVRGKAYIGVGPEQNLSYIALMRPAIAYIVDLRRQNLLQHMVFRALMEQARDRVHFLALLTCRDVEKVGVTSSSATVEEVAKGLEKIEASEDTIRTGVQSTMALMDRLGMKRRSGDEKKVGKILDAFASKGLDLAYSMKGSGRTYPSLKTLLSMRDPSDSHGSFLMDEASFSLVKEAYRSNRIVPVVGDFAGNRALGAVAKDMQERGFVVGVFYTSNVEQYLFEGGVFHRFVDNVKALPVDDSSGFVRVWFDQGRAHPEQQSGHRTTSLAMPIKQFLERQSTRPYPTYWHVVADREAKKP